MERKADGYTLSGEGTFIELVNEFLGYLSDRNSSPRTARTAQRRRSV